MNPWKFDVSLAIPCGSQIMLLPDGSLPTFRLKSVYSHLHLLQRELRATFNAEMTLRRWITERADKETRTVDSIWLVENHTPNWTPPPGAIWIESAESIQDEWLRTTLTKAFDLIHDDSPCPPWFKHGWFAETQQWITTTLTDLGHTITSPPEQFKQSFISTLLRAETSDGVFFFKVPNTRALFCDEPTVTRRLSALFPQHIPEPVAIDAPRHWMIVPNMGETLRDSEDQTPEVYKRVLREYARLQIQTIPQINTLLAAGCLDRRLSVLINQLDEVAADESIDARLTPEERTAWHATLPKVKALCAELEAFNVPHTLVHGDFHAANIIVQDDRMIFFDWTDACIAHPFLDPLPLIDFDAPDHAETLRDTYLECWTDFAPMDELRRAYDIASIVAAAHQIVSYQRIRIIIPSHDRTEWEWAEPYFIRLILKQSSG